MVSPRLEREKVSCARSSDNGEHIVAMFAIGILLIITVGLAILYYSSSTIINLRTCFLK
jgi:tRNA G37 N-methylase Trm5